MKMPFWYSLILFLPLTITAQIILKNATVYTLDPKQPWAEAIVIDDNTITYVGTNTQALLYQSPHSNIIDMNGSFVMPGLIDAHTHIAIASVLLKEGVNLTGSKGKNDVLKKIETYALAHPDAPVITGFGFYPYSFGQNGPSASQLDAIIPDKPAFLISNNGHSAWANTLALKRLGITKHTPDPQPGIHYYVREKDGSPTGFLVEGCALWPHAASLGIGTKNTYHDSLKDLLPLLPSQGITAVFDAGAPASETKAFNALMELESEQLLPIRFYGSHYILSRSDALDASKTFIAYQKRYHTPLVNVSGVKFVNDNSDDDHFAIQFNEDEFHPFLENLLEHNIDAMIHTSADQSVHSTLNAIEKAKHRFPDSQSRFTLAHVNMVRDSDFGRFNKLGIIANIQPFNATGGGYYDYRYMLYGDEWENKLVRFKTFFDNNIVVSGSSDFPACDNNLSECSPFHHMQIGITRQKVDNKDDLPILPSTDERLNVAQMLQAYTINAAYQLHQEKYLGSLEIGKYADLIVLDQSPFEISPKNIHSINVLLTMMNGKIVYQKDSK